MKAVEIRNLEYTYACSEQPCIHGIDLSIEQGSCVLLAGASGGGKSTLLNCINGLNPLHYGGTRSGEVRVMDREIADLQMWEISEIVGTVFQNPNTQFFQCNVEDELAFGLECRCCSSSGIRERILEYSRRMRIYDLLHRDIFSISSGERQRVAVAAVAALGQDVLLFDEPSANLDPDATRDLAEVLRDLKAEGRTIIISEHRIHYLRGLVDRVIVLKDGAITYEGSPDALDDPDFRSDQGLRTWFYKDIKTLQTRLSDSAQPPLLSVRDVALRMRRATPILKAASFHAHSGECIGIAGPNGAGKTTLAKALAGLEPKATGSVELDGLALSPRQRIGKIVYMPQQADQQLFADSVYDELVLSAANMLDASDHISETLSAMDLAHLADKHPHALSGGEKQRVAIAAMVAMKPRVLMLDEPTSGMDGRRMMLFARQMRKLTESGCAVLIITHDFEFISECCDRVVWMEDGATHAQYSRGSLDRLLGWFTRNELERTDTLCSR